MIAGYPFLTTIVFLPFFGGLLALAFRRQPSLCRWLSLVVLLIDLFLVLFTLSYLDYALELPHRWMLVEDFSWIETFGIRYTLKMDPVSFVLVLLTSYIGIICVLVSWKSVDSWVGAFHFFLLSTQTAILGVFLATDLFLFYLFWEAQIIPVYFLIGIWGYKREARIRATVKFFVYSMFGSLLMLLSIIGLVLLYGARTGYYTFALSELVNMPMSLHTQLWLFAAFILSFAIKVPIFPLHTWLPDAHTEAPTAGSVALAGLLLKTGIYGTFRFAFPLFPLAASLSIPLLMALGLVGIFYAAWIALAQKDIKRMVAYSSISHMGLIVIGIAAWDKISLTGAVLQLANHGVTTSALFIMVGMLAERTHTRQFSDVGGLWKKMPVFSGFFLFFAMAFVSLPGTNNFTGEILILLGTFRRYPAVAIIAFATMIFSLVYTLRMVQESLFGESVGGHEYWDVTHREALVLISLAAAVLFVGLYPVPLLSVLDIPVERLLHDAAILM